MTPLQLFERLKTYFEQTLTWGTTENLVFGPGHVYIVPEVPIEQLAQFRTPTVFIIDQGFVCDTEHPGLANQNFSLTLYLDNINCPMGESALIGSGRVADTSEGAGMLDIIPELLRKLSKITGLTTKLLLIEKGGARNQIVSGANRPQLLCPLNFEALVSVY